jgi:hypothetical protein
VGRHDDQEAHHAAAHDGTQRVTPPGSSPAGDHQDPALIVDDLVAPTGAIEVTASSGPRDEREVCPLVMDGTCPLGPCDIVVSALVGPWAPSVRAAWAQTSTPIVDATDPAATDPAQRLHYHLGAALQRLWSTYHAVE